MVLKPPKATGAVLWSCPEGVRLLRQWFPNSKGVANLKVVRLEGSRDVCLNSITVIALPQWPRFIYTFLEGGDQETLRFTVLEVFSPLWASLLQQWAPLSNRNSLAVCDQSSYIPIPSLPVPYKGIQMSLLVSPKKRGVLKKVFFALKLIFWGSGRLHVTFTCKN